MSGGCSLRSASGRLILLSTTLASGSSFMSGSAVPVILPRLQTEFNTAFSGIQWVVNANLIALSALILIGGALGDRYGRKRIFIFGLALFSIAAFFTGLAPFISTLIPLQALQGVGSALMIPQGLAIINDCFEERERGRAIGLWAGLSGAIAATGPLAAGWLVDNLSWRWVFFMMTLIGLVALAAAVFFVPKLRATSSHRLDWFGGVLILLGLFGLTYGLLTGPGKGWDSPDVLTGLGGGITAIILFVYFENRQPQPLVQLKMFRSPLVAGANIVTFLLYFGLGGVFFFTVLNLQQVQGYSATEAGLALLPAIVLITILTWPSGAVADKIGPRPQMILGPLVVSAGMALFITAGTDTVYLLGFLPGLALFGIGMAIIIPPLTKSALSVPPAFSGSASGVNNCISRLAGLLAVSILGVIMLSKFPCPIGTHGSTARANT
jgi:EmrB/QacA subfamily drug resistance transporter